MGSLLIWAASIKIGFDCHVKALSAGKGVLVGLGPLVGLGVLVWVEVSMVVVGTMVVAVGVLLVRVVFSCVPSGVHAEIAAIKITPMSKMMCKPTFVILSICTLL
jgi:hypothetical protein